MGIDVQLDALTMTRSFSGATPQVSTEAHFQRDFLSEAAAEVGKPGPLLRLPDSPIKVDIDPRPR
jgi:hypothetical protein